VAVAKTLAGPITSKASTSAKINIAIVRGPAGRALRGFCLSSAIAIGGRMAPGAPVYNDKQATVRVIDGRNPARQTRVTRAPWRL